ncbi:MAG: DUF1223 domain-containing protein [Gammaproteobacteria bacterium]|nr:DUF1223 domain-containing protein [Gammaproteobacteria bacterium]MDH3411345.1 DUF1223 domain-containing protein [Gammaproteobacteria bacterium]
MRVSALLFFLAALLPASETTLAESLALESPAARVSLLELYTSEGCSSCPSADRWLSDLKDDPRLWREVVPVAFHVDYWDYIGWRDRFASSSYSQRQKSYARNGHLGSVYTPGFVLAGKEWRSWFFHRVLEVNSDDVVGALSLELNGDRASVAFDPVSLPDKSLELHVAVLGFDLETEVEAGENHGRTLRHDFVVLGHTRVDMRRIQGRLVAETALPKPRFESSRKAIAAWVSAVGDPYPIQAVGGWLRSD